MSILKCTKKKLEKILKENEFPIVENYDCCLDFSKEDFKNILSIKILNKYKILEDIDEFIYELKENDDNFGKFRGLKLNESKIQPARSTVTAGTKSINRQKHQNICPVHDPLEIHDPGIIH